MRNTAIMAALSVALLGGATYAWFTLSNTAKISNLSLTVGEASGLMIAPEVFDTEGNGKPGEYVSDLALTALDGAVGKLMPATLAKYDQEEEYSILKPTYSGNSITAYEKVNTSTEVMTDTENDGEYYYYEKVFYLMTAGSKLNIQLTAGSSVIDDTDEGGVAYPACDAIRIAFFDGDSQDEELLAVYEPNSDEDWGTTRTDKVLAGNITATNATLYSGDLIKQQKSDLTFLSNGEGTNSETLFTLTQSTDRRIIMRVYFEGSDAECCNIISLNKILGNLQFTTAQ